MSQSIAEMSRPSRTERLASSPRGRPKRRAATTNYLFKYQLSGDPGRVEENALKKALQESLEEHKSTSPMTAGAAVIANSRLQAGRNKFKQHGSKNNSDSKVNHGRRQQQQDSRAIMNSSTNSSDVSKASNDSSPSTTITATSSGSDVCRDTPSMNGRVNDNGGIVKSNKRLRSSASPAIPTPTPTKRAKLTTNGHSNRNNTNNNNKKCDNNDTSVLAGSPVPPFNRSVHKTYSRNTQSGQTNGGPVSESHRNAHVSPRTSTPIDSVRSSSPDNKSTKTEANRPSVSRSTQTSVKSAISQRNNLSVVDAGTGSQVESIATNYDEVTKNEPSGTSPPVQNQYLKFKRESKNYAYAKMTALQVNTSKSAFSGIGRSSSGCSKKGSPSGVLHNNSVDKSAAKSKTNQLGVPSRGSSKKSPSPSGASATKSDSGTSRGHHGSHSSAKTSIPRLNSSATSHEVNNHTVDLSNNQANVSVSKKRVAQGSWSLLGVPEEKILYLRDDEPPRRLICYPAIKHVEGDVIQVRDSVLLRSGAKQTDLPYIAKVCAFWQDAETGGVMMSLFWYYRPEHTEDGRKPHQLIDEIFASRHRDVDSVECIEDKCYVLTFNEYCRYRKRCKMEQVNATWSLTDVTIPVSNESYPRRNRIPDSDVNPELVFCCRQIYDSRNRRLVKNPLINPKYGHI